MTSETDKSLPGTTPHVKVAAGVIYDEEGKILVCRRGYGKNPDTDGRWEFPGGKLEPGETAHETIVRELREELDIEVAPSRLIAVIEHTYPTFTVQLHFIACRLLSGTPVLKEHSEMAWLPPAGLASLDFCPADLPALPLIAAAIPPQ